MMAMTVATLFAAVCLKENPNGIKGVHPDHVSYGVAGVTQGCLDDLRRVHPYVTYTLKDMDDPAKAAHVFKLYTDLRCTVKHLDPTPVNRLRVWHPTGNTDQYIDDVIALTRKGVKTNG